MLSPGHNDIARSLSIYIYIYFSYIQGPIVRHILVHRHGDAVAMDLLQSKKEMDKHGGTWWMPHPDLPTLEAWAVQRSLNPH